MKETANIDQERKVDPCCFSEMTRFNTMISSAPQKVLSNSCCRFQRRPPFFFFFSLFFFLFYSVGIAFFTADGKRGAAVFFAEGRSEKSDLAIQAPGEGEEEEETATIATGDDGPSSSSSFITFVIYGATGDLSKRKLYPTLFTLYCENQLPEEFLVAGLSNLELSTEDFRELHRPQLEKVWKTYKSKEEIQRRMAAGEGNLLNEFMSRMTYTTGSIEDDKVLQPFCESIAHLEQRISASHEEEHRWNRLLYLALPPSLFAPASAGFKRNCRNSTEGWSHVVVEKPFGHDLESAEELAKALKEVLHEDEIYRIDHYLGKEMLQAIPPLRFSNTVFEPLLNRHYVKEIFIRFSEEIGTEGRGGYFDRYGIIRDMMQNHLLQLLSLLIMERPATLDDEDIRDEKVKVLKQISPIRLQECVIGQYTRSVDGSKPGYLDDEGVPEDSRSPTYAVLALHVHNPRWEGVPFIMEAGKAMEKKRVEARVVFKSTPGFRGGNAIFPENSLVIEIQPEHKIRLEVNRKVAGSGTDLESGSLSMDVKPESKRLPDAYERLILDVMNSDKRNFVRTDELRESWRIFTPVLQKLDEKKVKPLPYPFGTPGPDGAVGTLRKALEKPRVLRGSPHSNGKSPSKFSLRSTLSGIVN